jgi:acyl-CoA synthetase (AMP-forming)/AMP-acid ligase II
MRALYSHIQAIKNLQPDKVALYFDERSYTYHELFELTLKCESLLLQTNISHPIRMVVMSESAPYLIAWALCLAKTNSTLIPVNCQLTREQLKTVVNAADANAVFCDEKFVKTCRTMDAKVLLTSDELDAERSTTTEAYVDMSGADIDDFLITFSSGSTGDPKPIMVDQATKLARAQQTIQLYGLTTDDVVLCASPFFHSLGQRHVFVALAAGATLVYMRRFTPADWIAAVHKYKISFVIAVSSHLQALKDDLVSNSNRLQSLKTIVTSSAPISNELKSDLFRRLGCNFHEIYGTTEVAVVSNLYPTDADKKYATVGTICEGVEVKILRDDLSECAQGEIGEIVVKTPLSFNGYYGKDDVYSQSLVDGFFRTGDIGKVDNEGFLSYISRKKDIIISGGINIYPKDIEDILVTCDAIDEVSVIGVPDDFLGEVVVAVCVADNTAERALRKIANSQLAPFQRPLKYFFVSSLPLSPTGKIQKNVLREEYAPLNTDWTLPLRALMYAESKK